VAFQQQAQGVENILLIIGNEDSLLYRLDFHRDLKGELSPRTTAISAHP
jgi:hypothetical protein